MKSLLTQVSDAAEHQRNRARRLGFGIKTKDAFNCCRDDIGRGCVVCRRQKASAPAPARQPRQAPSPMSACGLLDLVPAAAADLDKLVWIGKSREEAGDRPLDRLQLSDDRTEARRIDRMAVVCRT